MIAHTLGWWGKALILRDNAMLWTVSILFELLELTFQHLLPNFNECWWDSWLLDVAICNWIGIATGMWTVRYFKSKQYNWRGISQQPSLIAKAKRGLLQFTPHSFDDFRWQAFSSPKRCLQCFFPAAIILLFEVNHFFLKYELWVPPINPLNTIRLSLLFLMALPGMKVRGPLGRARSAPCKRRFESNFKTARCTPFHSSAQLACVFDRRSTMSSSSQTQLTFSTSWALLRGWRWPSPWLRP